MRPEILQAALVLANALPSLWILYLIRRWEVPHQTRAEARAERILARTER